ncbi:MAG: hypothetical protein LBT89_00325 [Planctomycetaceae bacterium]|jgi:tetratricopeptide (TPR) repeat protein|nr:hypothetical protein [Planctomycetaceae bacterium]
MMNTNKFFVICIIFCVLTAGSRADSPQNKTESGKAALRQNIARWIGQLGDESYIVRQRAEVHLLNSGLEAYPAVQKAKTSEDIEVVRRAEKILTQIEQQFIRQENPAVEYWIRQYTLEGNPAAKARIIRLFADIFSDASNGEGLQTLCRLVRFDESETLRIEAAKCLLASPPAKISLRTKWYRHIRDTFMPLKEAVADAASEDNGSGGLFSLLADYAALRCDMETAQQETAEKKALTGFQQRVRNVTQRVAAFQAKPEYSVIQPGNAADILMYYAAAIVQDAAGLSQECKKNTEAALAVEAQEVRSSEPVQAIELDDDWKMHEHYYAARWLQQNYRLRWALPHFGKIIDGGYIVLKIRSANSAADISVLTTDYTAAVKFYDKVIELAGTEEYTKKLSNGQAITSEAQIRRYSCLAEQSAGTGDWLKVREYLDKGLGLDKTDIDLLILAHRYCKANKGTDADYRSNVKYWSHQSLVNIQNTAIPPSNDADDRRQAAAAACNQAAWLLAHTDGDYPSAKALINAAVQAEPEDLSYTDTLSAVYFLGGEIGKAVETQERVVRSAPEVTVFQKALEKFKAARK